MINFRLIKKIIFSVALTFSLKAGATENGFWQYHPSFTNEILISDGNDSINYYLVRQQPFDSRYEDYLFNTATIFVTDKLNPQKGIRPLTDCYKNIPLIYQTFLYSKDKKKLVAAADDGRILILEDNSEPIIIYGMDHISLPGDNHITSIFENPEDGTFIVGATFGYGILHPEENKFLEINITGKPYVPTQDLKTDTAVSFLQADSEISAPRPFIASYMACHPQLGIIVSNHGIDNLFSQSAPNVPLYISAFKNGVWKDLSPVNHLPKEIKENDTYLKILNNSLSSYPVSNPDGLALDPNNPDYAYFGSLYGGWVRVNLAKSDEVPLHIATNGNSFSSFPGFIADAPVMSQWNALCDFSAPSFDSEGNLWMLFYDQDESFSNTYSLALMAYTADELKKMTDAHRDTDKYKKPNKITIKTPADVTHAEKVLALTHPNNRNIIVMHTGSYSSPLIFMDHNGTPVDPSDDRIVQLTHLNDKNSGASIPFASIISLWEDPFDGMLWVSNMLGTFKINPQLAFSDPENSAEKHLVNSMGKSIKPDKKILDTIQVNAFTTDDRGRLWIGTDRGGLLCLSADRSSILGEYNTQNSSLISDRIFALIYNQERNSIMISSGLGIMEFFQENDSGESSRITVTPSAVTPDYHGYVAVKGLNDNIRYVITDKEDNIIAGPISPHNHMLQWRPENDSGERMQTGTYYVKDESGDKTYAKFIILK